MRTLTATVSEIVDKPYTAPILLVDMFFSGLTLRLSSRAFDTLSTVGSNVYDPAIINWSPIRSNQLEPINYKVTSGEVTFTITNTVPVGGYENFTKLIVDKKWAFVDVDIYMIFEEGVTEADRVKVFKGKIENIRSITRDSTNVTISDTVLSFKDKWDYEIADSTTYPGIDPDDVGKMFPQVWGTCKRVPFLGTDNGVIDSLAEDLDDSETSIDVSDATRLPNSGVIQIDAEKISYTGITDQTLTGATRGVSGTDATTHTSGATVAEVKDEYVYAIGHPVKSIDAVYVSNILQDAGIYTAYTGQSGARFIPWQSDYRFQHFATIRETSKSGCQ
jgi:hypothetical protein